jgi:hypothetical protein
VIREPRRAGRPEPFDRPTPNDYDDNVNDQADDNNIEPREPREPREPTCRTHWHWYWHRWFKHDKCRRTGANSNV